MADIKPETYFTNALTYDSTNNKLEFPIAALPGATAAEVDPYSGDIRKIMLGIVKGLFNGYNALPVADRPAKFSVTRGTPTGVNPTTVRQTYTLTFDLDIAETDLATE